MLGRIIATVVTMIVSGWLSTWNTPISSIGASRMAGLQMTNSDAYGVMSYVGMRLFSGFGAWIIGATFLVLLAIWWRPMKRHVVAAWKEITAPLIALVLLSTPSHAFYSAIDVTEAYGILPNHSAFWVPGMGDTKNNQAQMESEEFL